MQLSTSRSASAFILKSESCDSGLRRHSPMPSYRGKLERSGTLGRRSAYLLSLKGKRDAMTGTRAWCWLLVALTVLLPARAQGAGDVSERI